MSGLLENSHGCPHHVIVGVAESFADGSCEFNDQTRRKAQWAQHALPTFADFPARCRPRLLRHDFGGSGGPVQAGEAKEY